MKTLYFKGYPAGLSNNRLALDIGVALAWLTGRTLAMYDDRSIWSGSNPQLANAAPAVSSLSILDLYDLPVTQASAAALQSGFGSRTEATLDLQEMAHALIFLPAGADLNTPRFNDFRNGRQLGHTITPEMEAADVLHVCGKTLGLYAYGFFLEEDQHRALNRIMGGIVPRAPYRRFATELAAHLGPFNAIHIRRGDFVGWSSAPRTQHVTPAEILDNLSGVLPTGEQLVICTDESSNKTFFAPILKAYPDALFIDRYILEDARWAAYFKSLPCSDDVVLAFVSQILASLAECFVGTLSSTFTGLVHRTRGFEQEDKRFLYAYSQFGPEVPFRNCEFIPTREGTYSWNRFGFPVPPQACSWLREWPEAFE